MRLIILSLLFSLVAYYPLKAQVEQDKALHFAVGAVSGAAGAYVASELSGKSRFWTVTGAIATSLAAGLAKEAVDKRRYGSWDNADLGATVLGGVTVGVTIELFAKKNGRRYQSRKMNRASVLFDVPVEAVFLTDSLSDSRDTSNLGKNE